MRGDTLDVETRNVRGLKTWDQSGMPMADDNEAVIKERLYLDNVLRNEMTTTDNSPTRRWSVVKNYQRARDVVWVENSCTNQKLCREIVGINFAAEGALPFADRLFSFAFGFELGITCHLAS